MSVDNVAEICLVVPPFGSVHFPHLGTAVLKRACVARGLSARIVYGNLRLAARIGIDRYDVVNDAPMRVMLGDRIFREHAYPSESLSRLPEPPPLREDLETLRKSIADEIEPTLDMIVEEILALNPRIVGLSSTFQQNLACAAISLRIKQAAPEICVVMGGANAAWPICQGLAQAFPWIDHFFAGESDTDFPDFCERLIRNGKRIDDRIIQSEPIRDMRTVSAPVFDDYFATLRPLQAEGSLPDWLPRYLMAESSRGCWWGAKSHCTFCGLNGDGMQFRDKTAQHLREELEALAQWGVDMVYMADNIMPLNYLRNLFPALALIEPQVKLFYEVKANLSTANIDVLKRGGVVSIQPGIESLSSDVLKLMRKGVSAHQNVALLRDSRGAGLTVHWGIIYGFPGEAAAHYEAMIRLMPQIEHLQPPNGAHRIIIDRFSPFFRDPRGTGIGEVSPIEGYRALYPSEVDTADIAYHFDGHYSTALLENPDLLGRLQGAVEAWKAAWISKPVAVLELFEREDGALVFDTRSASRQPVTKLTIEQRNALIALERPHKRAALDPALAAETDWLIEKGFIIDYENVLISIVVRPRKQEDELAPQQSSHATPILSAPQDA